jgi:outer membrane protein assembly factor BamB/mono/diheme cytochrome c family protein
MRVREGRPSPVSSRLALPAAVVALFASATLIAACGGDDEEGPVEASTGWNYPNADLRNTRWVEGEIDSTNVTQLNEAWSVPIEAAGYAATPVSVGGVVYTQDLDSNVYAIDFETGEVLWTQEYNSPNVGPNGVNVADGRVYGATTTDAFALDAETGDELWTKRLVRNQYEGIDMAPGYNDGTVYVSTVPGNTQGFYEGNGQAILWALDPETGEEKWKWEEVPADLWGNKNVNSGGGQWHSPAFDDEGDVYVAVANPAPFPGLPADQPRSWAWGATRPGDNLYTNSCVKLDAETGEVEWHYQALPHDVYDWDLQIGPILAQSAEGDPVVLCAGKMGKVYGIDQESGELLWETPVGEHSGHDNDNLLALEERYDELPKAPFELLPGILGGVETQMAIDESKVYVPTNNLAYTVTDGAVGMSEADPSQGTGEMVALDIGTGQVEWEHDFDTSPYGGASVVNDLVFTTTYDGMLWALNADSGEVEWEQQLPAGSNTTVAIETDTVITAGSVNLGAGDQLEIVAYRLGAEGAPPEEEEPPAEEPPAEEPPEEEPPQEEQPEQPEQGGGQAAAEGEQIFVDNCGVCHALAAVGSGGPGAVGPDLDELQPSLDVIVEQVTNGGGGMPAFAGRLSEAEIQAVAEFVSSVAGQGGG